jgi:tetratricopeptide (TPR) repeat protein
MASNPASRRLWQVPLFLLGVSALVAFLVARPYWNNPRFRAEVRLGFARRIFVRNEGEADRQAQFAREYLEVAGPDDDLAGEAHLLLGSALARTARHLRGGEALPLWKEAHDHLAQAERLGVPESDAALLSVTLGESGYHTGDEANAVIGRLSKHAEAADDRAEVYHLLTLAYLKRQPPDYKSALRANEQLRQVPLVGEDVLGPARLQGGEILLKLRRPTEARNLLKNISEDAPPALLARARVLRARSHMGGGEYEQAATLWQEVLADSRHPSADPAAVLYQLGVCQRRLDQREEAVVTWTKVAKSTSDAGTAAALALADLLLAMEERDETAIAMLLRAADAVRPGEWANPLFERKKAAELFEGWITRTRQAGNFDSSLALAKSYERFALPGAAARLRGQTQHDQALALLQTGKSADRAKSTTLLREAGASYQAAALAGPKPDPEYLWLSAKDYSEGKDYRRAVPVLERFVTLAGQPAERSGEAWYLLGQAQEQLKNPGDAEAGYRRCISFRSRFAYRARFRLAETELARNNIDRASEMLKQNLTELRLHPDDEALEKTLYTLGGLLHRQAAGGANGVEYYPLARSILEEAVTRFPSSAAVVRGRFELADSYRQLSAIQLKAAQLGNPGFTKQTRAHFIKLHKESLQKAARQYDLLSEALRTDPHANVELSEAEQVHVEFSVADCRFDLGDYPTALKLYDALAERYADRLERLTALGGAARCYAARREFPKYRERLQAIRVSLKNVDDQTRREWEDWLSKAGKAN